MFVKFIKITNLLKIIFIATLHQHTFAECFYDCWNYCCLFCNCCYSDIITEEDIPILKSVGKDHIYIWEKDEGEVVCEILYVTNLPYEIYDMIK